MPAIDICEPQVVHALEKLGYQVTHQPYAIRLNQPREPLLFADLRLVSTRDTTRGIIVVEVKCFASGRNVLDELYGAVGQCMMYRTILEQVEPDAMVYLSVPRSVHQAKLNNQSVIRLMREARLGFLVVDLETEEVVSWSP
ncbi:MAG: hypothetical protein MUC99_12980 [Anaerolineae bacterium]|jgi:hypothetical protein|nr:hypothetical protein [Anaerolineae bacterium]